MENYSDYTDGGWMGDVPASWSINRISSLYEARNTKVSDRDYAPLSVTMQGILPQLETAAKTQDGDNRKLVLKGDFAINSRSDRRGSCGISGYDGSVSLITNVLAPKNLEAMDSRYYGYLFKSERFADEYYKYGTGIVDDLWSTNWSRMKNILVCVPPVAEQKAIAGFLDAKTAEIDELIADTEKSIELAEEFRASIIAEAVTKGLDPNAPMRDSGIGCIGEIPAHWECKKLKYQIDSSFKGAGITKDDIVENGDIACIRYGEIYSKYDFVVKEASTRTDASNVSSKVCLEYGDLLFAGTGELIEEIGKAVAYLGNDDCLAGGDIVVFRHHQNPEFMSYACNSASAQTQKSIGKSKLKVVHISAAEIGQVVVPLPPLAEQIAIADYLNSKMSAFDALVAAKYETIEKLKEYRKSLILDYVTGKTRVPEVA